MNPNFVNTASATPAGVAPRERIVTAACDLFYRHGIRAVGVDAIAEAAGTNKMPLYRHFTSKDVLVAACLSELTQEFDAARDALATSHAGDPEGQLLAWLRHVSDFKENEAERGCALANGRCREQDKMIMGLSECPPIAA